MLKFSHKVRTLMALALMLCLTLSSHSHPTATAATSSPAPTSAPAGASTTTITGRPANVPADYVVTPFGYRHRSCVNALNATEVAVGTPQGQTIVDFAGNASAKNIAERSTREAPTSNGEGTGLSRQLTPAELRAGRKVSQCRFGAFDAKGQILSESTTARSEGAPTFTNGWLLSTQSQPTPMTKVSGTWNVPAAPTEDVGQTIFFFPGVQTVTDLLIMQPVLRWFKGEWTIASWSCCREGTVNHSEWKPVTSSVVWGQAVGTDCDARSVCADWTIDTIAGRERSTHRTTGNGIAMTLSVGGALETYGVQTCAHLPRGKATFNNLRFETGRGLRVVPTFDVKIPAPNQCNFAGVVTTSTSHTLTWSN